MQTAFQDAEVAHYEPLIGSLRLPGPDERHMLAAIRCHAAVIVTANLKDFPAPFDLEIQHPNAFIANLIDLNPS